MAIKIMLDAGHEGKTNQSPVVPEYYESDMNWKLHLLLKTELEKYGFEVGLTRKSQEQVLEVTRRGRKAKGYDLFLSIHSNAAIRASADHALVIYSYENLNNADILAKKLTVGITTIMGLSEDGIIGSRKHEFEDGIDEYYGVLRGAKAVGCPLFYILEHSFHTNVAATKWLLDDNNLEKLAAFEAEIIAEHYNVNIIEPIKGDVNGDGILDAKDYLLAKRAILGTITLTEEQIDRTDVDNDGKLTSKDYLMIKRAILGTFKL